MKIIGTFILFCFFGTIILSFGSALAASPEEKLDKLKMDACNTLRVYEEKCHYNDQEQCAKLKSSGEWFSNKFNSSPMECFSINSDFLVLG